jgi:integrase-like protein
LAQTRYGERILFDENSQRKDPYTPDEFSSITMADGDARSMFTLLGRWGLRISELAMLKCSDIDDVGGWLHIRNKRTHDGIDDKPKDKTDRKIPLEGRAIIESLKALAGRTGRTGRTGRIGYVLPLPPVKQREDYAERHFLKKLKELAECTRINPKRLTLHRFRHFFFCECADHGIPMATVMAWVGHDEMKMVMNYFSLRDESARDAMRKLTTDSTASRRPPEPSRCDIDQRAGRVARHRTTSNALEQLGSDPEKTASQTGNAEQRRGGDSNPRYRCDPVRRFSKPLLSAAQPPLQREVKRRLPTTSRRIIRQIAAPSSRIVSFSG